MGCQTQKARYHRGVTCETGERPTLTPKGEQTRARIIDVAARLIYERGVAGTRLEDIRVSADVSGSQLQHYFAGKDELVQAVIGHQADMIARNQRQADLGGTGGLQAWRDMLITTAKNAGGRGGCPLGSLGGQLAESDPRARALIADGFEQWSAAISDGLRALPPPGTCGPTWTLTTSPSPSSPLSKGACSSPRSSGTPVRWKPPSTPSSPSRRARPDPG